MLPHVVTKGRSQVPLKTLVCLLGFLTVSRSAVILVPHVQDDDSEPSVVSLRDNIDERGPYLEGDMILSPSIIPGSKSGLVQERMRWPNNEIVYTISSNFSASEQGTIAEAMNEISDKTCIRFKPQSTERGYVNITKAKSGCFASVGRTGGPQILNLGKGCLSKGTIIHELIHAIGFFHEQSRTDRDDYVTVDYSNVQTGKERNFAKYKANYVTSFNVTYDYGSIMHYSAYAFAKNSTIPTIVVTDAKATIGQRKGLSEFDSLKINRMYNC